MNENFNPGTTVSLHNLYRSDDAFKKLIDWFSERQKNSVEMPVRTAAGRTGLADAEIKRVFHELERLGCGHYIKGGRGYESRMQWEKSIISLAAVAKGEAKSIDAAPVAVPDPLEKEDSRTVEAPEDHIQHSFALRPDVSINIVLPSDFTSREAERVAAFIKSLPFSV